MELLPGLSSKWCYGTAFRAPTFTDLYYPGASNPDLKPEESDNIEVTVEGSAFEAFWRVTAYRNLIDNMLQWDPVAYHVANLGAVRLRGIEAEGEFTECFLHRVLPTLVIQRIWTVVNN